MSEQYVCTHCGYVMAPTGAELGACTNKEAQLAAAQEHVRAILDAGAIRAEQAEAQVTELRAALADLLQQARTVTMGWRKVRLEVTVEPEVYDALRALLAEPGA